jgi:hypothetical protein
MTASMTVTSEQRPPMRRSTRLAIVGGALLALLALAAWLGYRTGANQPTTHWHYGQANSMERQISASADGWAYDIPLDVPWRDATGTTHQSGRADCLTPSQHPILVRFAEVHVDIDGLG